MSQHDTLGLNATHAPADDAQPIDHGGVTVGTDQRIGDSDRSHRVLAEEDAFGEEFEVHLMHDADVGRHGPEIVERILAPAQKLVTFLVSGEFEVDIQRQRIQRPERVDLNRVVDDKIDGNQRIDLFRIAPHAVHRTSHGRKIDDGRDARKILQHDSRGQKRNLHSLRRGAPCRQILDVIFLNGVAVAVTQDGFQQQSNRVWQGRNGRQSGIFKLGQSIDASLATACVKGVSSGKLVVGGFDLAHSAVVASGFGSEVRILQKVPRARKGSRLHTQGEGRNAAGCRNVEDEQLARSPQPAGPTLTRSNSPELDANQFVEILSLDRQIF